MNTLSPPLYFIGARENQKKKHEEHFNLLPIGDVISIYFSLFSQSTFHFERSLGSVGLLSSGFGRCMQKRHGNL